MKKLLLFIIWAMFFLQTSLAQIILKKPLSSRQTYYSINTTLDPIKKTVAGEMSAFWVNKSEDIVPDVQLHLYMNAFKSNKTTFFREAGGKLRYKESDYGWIDIKYITDRKGTDLIHLMKYISPDDGNRDDMTVVKISLPEPAKPGDTVFLKIGFESKLPAKIIRTGYSGDYFFVAQWFPKFGVYENAGMRYAVKGGWNCHQFHNNSEFYSNHSVYDVKITLPKKYVVGSGGLLLQESDAGNGNKTLTYRAEDIVDFAWTAWPGYKTFTGQWKNVRITLLLPSERTDQVERQLKAVKYALEYFTANVGAYPWPYLTFADPPAKGNGAGGMEYTTLFTSSSFTGIPDYLHIPEMVTIHEFGHAYFMGILASNEFEEPWLDEGVNSFWEERIVDHYYGINSGLLDHPWLKISDESVSRLSYVTSENRQAASSRLYSWKFPHGTYGMISYNKTAVIFYTLMGLVGEETINEIFREYYRKWAFNYPSGQDLIDIVNEVVHRMHGNKFGPDMNWFFAETIFGTGICDYKVSDFHNLKSELQVESGISGDTSGGMRSGSKLLYKAVVELERAGEVILPVDVLVHFSNGDEVRELWDGKSRTRDFTYTGNRTIDWVKIDPEFKIKMDINYINNSMTAEPDHIPVRRITDKLISFMQFFINFLMI